MMKKLFRAMMPYALLLLALAGCGTKAAYPFSGDYEADRAGFPTSLEMTGPCSLGENPDLILPGGASEVAYRSGDLELKAWVTPDPGDGVRRPAIVYLHGAFYFDESDWRLAAEATEILDFVVMTPMLRSENGNPGNFEYFRGEVDDALNAGRYLASLDYVDPDNIYLYGFSTGGSLATLTALVKTDNPYKAIVTSGASYGTDAYFKGQRQIIPFQYSADEIRIRSAQEYAGNLVVPVTAYVGQEDTGVLPLAQSFAEETAMLQIPYVLELVDGDHLSADEEAFYRGLTQFYDLTIQDYLEKGILTQEDLTDRPLLDDGPLS